VIDSIPWIRRLQAHDSASYKGSPAGSRRCGGDLRIVSAYEPSLPAHELKYRLSPRAALPWTPLPILDPSADARAMVERLIASTRSRGIRISG